MKKWKKILTAAMFISVAAVAYGFYLYQKKPADIRQLSAEYVLTATALLNEFNANESTANHKYVDKVLSVKGKITGITTDPFTGQATVMLDTGDPMAAITCSFYNEEAASLKSLGQGAEVIVKGNCTGKLMDVVLNKCSIEQQTK